MPQQRTIVTIDRKTAKVTFDVQDGQGTSCQEKNRKYYDGIRKLFGLPLSAAVETAKPEMEMNTNNQETETEHERR